MPEFILLMHSDVESPPNADVRAADLEEARGRLAGNPIFEHGGTVEIRELPQG